MSKSPFVGQKQADVAMFGNAGKRTFFSASFSIFSSKSEKKPNNRYFHQEYETYDLLNERDVPVEVVFHRIHGGSPKEVAQNGFSGRKDLPKTSLKAYVALNMPYPGFGGTSQTEHALDFAKNGANNKKNYLYSSLNPNKKISILNMLHLEVDDVNESNIKQKMSEMEVMALGDIGSEFILYATDDFENFSKGLPVKNLLSDYNPDVPKTYTKNDVVSPASILLHLAKTGNTSIIAKGIEAKIFTQKDLVELSKRSNCTELADYLQASCEENQMFAHA
ncbi:TPA: hypothetical protein ACU9KK_000192 [Legionella anisa]|nr:hypothetical protein [Legionella anisa]MBN5934233.1 hypothetical protein [Legionella anisa]MCW8425583.1 hypothetical protein [Legionella anisa]MCW8448987.1 hypothetical protein [Legionella anisa]